MQMLEELLTRINELGGQDAYPVVPLELFSQATMIAAGRERRSRSDRASARSWRLPGCGGLKLARGALTSRLLQRHRFLTSAHGHHGEAQPKGVWT